MKQLIFAIFSIVLISSCAVHNGSISSSPIGRHVQYVDVAYGISQTSKVFGIGGLGQDAMVLEAKRNLINSRPLQQNEEYANFTLDTKNTTILIYSETKVTLSADIVRYVNDSLADIYSSNYKNKFLGNTPNNELFSVGDSIVDEKMNKGIVLGFDVPELVKVMFISQTNKLRTKTLSINNIYTTKKDFKEFKIGDNCIRQITRGDYVEKINGKILATGLNGLIIQDNSGIIRAVYQNK